MKMRGLLPALVLCATAAAAAERHICHLVGPDNQIERAKRLIEKDPTIVSKYHECGRTPLMVAADFNRIEIAKMLIAAGADVNAVETGSRKGSVLLHALRGSGSLEMVTLLVESGADTGYESPSGIGMLYRAAREGDVDIMRYLLANGAVINEDEGRYRPAIAAVKGNHPEALKLLLEHGADPLKPKRYSALACALYRGRHPCLGLLVADWAKREAFAAFGAAFEGRLADLKAFVERDAALVNRPGPEKLGLLHVAALGGGTEVVQWLLDSGARRDARSKGGLAPLHMAAMAGHTDTVAALIAAGANLEARTTYASTPLFVAALSGRAEIVRQLAAAGADIDAVGGPDPRTPLHAAARAPSLDMVNVLIEIGADVDVTSHGLRTPLHGSAEAGDAAVARALLAAGADVNAPDWHGRTPTREASHEGHQDVVRVLREAGGLYNLETQRKPPPSLLQRLLGGGGGRDETPAPRSDFATVNSIKKGARTVVLVPVGNPDAAIIESVADMLRRTLKLPVLIEEKSISLADLGVADLNRPAVEGKRAELALQRRVRSRRSRVSVVGITDVDVLSGGNWRFSYGHDGACVVSYRRLGGPYHHRVVERVYKQALAKSTAGLGLDRCRRNPKTCPRAGPNSLGALDGFDLNMCKACATEFKKSFGHDPGRVDAVTPVDAVVPVEAEEIDEVF